MEVNQQIIAHRRDVGEFNDLFTCRICHGYMIDPTTVDYCYHTYCRSCILKHLLRDVYCPQCKGSGGKQITEDNLRSDDALRALIYKMIPGLYQRECQRLVEFEEQHKELDGGDVLKTDMKQEFFTAAEPISLSLEYHPAMLKHCRASDKPPVCYLQCPAGLRIEHLKKFLCSKYDIDAQNKQVEVEVTYEDEVLPPTQTLMDVGYCYHWDRHAPMSFQYRILLYESETTKNDENNLSKVNRDIELRPAVAATKSGKSVTFADEVDIQRLPQANKTRSKSTMKVNKGKKINQVQVQATAGRQREISEEGPQSLSNFKSLRSNDMRYSDYGVSCSSTTCPTTATATAATAPLLRVKSEPETEEQSNLGVSNMNIVVSIPQSQLSKSAVYGDEGFELKTANKKTTNATVRNLPKLKIELNSMKAKLSMPKSADARLEDATIGVQQQLDLETYAKNIGLKPIEQTSSTPVALAGVDALKYSPNASPMSSCSSSTNGSNGTADASTSTSCSSSSSSSHRKRKKKHSKEPKDANGKRKKLHAEISSQTDGKMKMKITTTHNHKAHKLDLKRSHSLAGGELVSLNQLKLVEEQASKESKDSESLNALNRTLGEEARSINNLMTGSPSPSPSPSASLSPSSHPAANCNATLEKLPRGGKEPNLPASPPLPPSLFKSFSPSSNPLPKAATPPLNPTAAATVAKAKVLPQKPAKPSATANNNNNNNNNNNHNNRKPTLTTCSTPLPLPFSLPLPAGTPATPHFAVPHAPRQAPHQMLRYLSTPSSIASSANKQPKRSLSLDEQHQQQLLQQQLAKQPRLDYQQQLAAKLKAGQNRLYGPELAKPMPNMPMLCPTSYSLSLPSATAAAAAATIGSVASSVTITPRARNTSVAATATATATATTAMHGLSYPYGEGNSTLSNHPGLEIVRLKAATGRLMGPPKQPARRATSAQLPQMPLPMPAIVNSPPLSVALSAQRGNNKHNSNNSNNAAYRTSPPALINLRNNVPLSFPSKSAAKVELNSKKSATVAAVAIATTAAAAAAAANAAGATATTTGKANGTTLLDKSKTSLRDFRPPLVPTATTTATATTAKDADNILDLSAGTGRNNNSNNISSSSSSNSLEAALNKIKQNISANNNNNNSNSSNNNNSSSSSNCSAAAAAAAAAGDDLQNLHMLSESATAREKISIKAGSNNNKNNNNNNNINNNSSSSNIYENKPKNALVRPQNASVRSIPNPSALAFRNQATLLTTSSPAATVAAATATPTTTTTATSASIVAKPLTVKAEEKPKLSAATMLLSPNNNNNNNNSSSNNNNNSCSNNNNAATSPRATKKATTIDQVAANLNILAEAKAAALAEEAPLPSVASVASAASVASVPSVVAAKMPELEKTSSNNLAKTNVKESTGVKATATTTTAAAATAAETTAAATIATTTAATTAAATVAATTTSATAAVTATAATATVSAATTSTATPLPLPLPLPTPTPTTTAAAAATATATAASVNSDSLSKPPVQISATDTPVPVASSA